MSAEHVQAAIAALDTMADDDREPERYRTDFRAAAEHFRSLLAPTSWRFDVPEVPDSVTAFKDGDEMLWVRRTDNPQLWSRWRGPDASVAHALRIGNVITLGGGLPLVECEDPRAAS